MEEKLGRVGNHQQVEVVDGKDINGRIMVKCKKCGTYAHAFNKEEAIDDLGRCACVSNCQNCNNLRNSSSARPAVPTGGDCNTILHTCPNDGNHWWQSNDYFHLWQQVTSLSEWKCLNQEY